MALGAPQTAVQTLPKKKGIHDHNRINTRVQASRELLWGVSPKESKSKSSKNPNRKESLAYQKDVLKPGRSSPGLGKVTARDNAYVSSTGQSGYTSRGKASYYWQGTKTASGERFNPGGISCAHRTLPFGTKLRVTNLSNGRSVVCRVNDRGPFIAGRIVDLSKGAAAQVGMLQAGVVPVTIERVN